MANQNLRRAGLLLVNVNGERLDVHGNWTVNVGAPKREALVGADRVHGFKEMPQVPSIEGEGRDRADLDLKALFNTVGATITIEWANGKTGVLSDAWYAGDGTVESEEGKITLRFEGLNYEEF